MQGMALERREDIGPICPHCDTEIATFFYREVSGTYGRRYVYFCGLCRKVLGLSHRKGFFMG